MFIANSVKNVKESRQTFICIITIIYGQPVRVSERIVKRNLVKCFKISNFNCVRNGAILWIVHKAKDRQEISNFCRNTSTCT